MLPAEYLYYLIGLIYDRVQALRITVQKDNYFNAFG